MNFADNLKRICTERGTSPTALLKSMGVPYGANPNLFFFVKNVFGFVKEIEVTV